MAKERINYNDINDSWGNLVKLASNFQETAEDIENSINSIKSAWEGTAASAYVEKIQALSANLPDANRQIAEAALFLRSCSDGYEAIEEDMKEQLIKIVGSDFINNYDAKSAPDVDLSSRVTIPEPTVSPEVTNDNNLLDNDAKIQYASMSSSPSGYSYGGPSPSGYIGGYASSSAASVFAATATSAATQHSNSSDKKEEKPEEKIQEKPEDKIETLKKGEKIEIQNDIKQAENKVKDYTDNNFEKDSAEESVEKIWQEQGSTSEEGFATIKVDEEERYLVKVSPRYGEVGDSIDISLEDGSVVKCVIAETKEIAGENASPYGTADKDGNINIVEFETTMKSDEIKFNWDKKSSIKEISNNGSILENKKATSTESTEK